MAAHTPLEDGLRRNIRETVCEVHSTLHCTRNEKMLVENVAMLADAPLQEARVDILGRNTALASRL